MSNIKVIAKAKNIRGSARKARIPADVVRGMMVDEALAILEYMPKKAAADVYKVVNSARANAIHNYNMNPERLKISNIQVGQGMKLRRIKPKSRGMASVINKQFNNITVEVIEVSDEEPKTVEKEETGKKTKTTKPKTENKAETKKATAKKHLKKLRKQRGSLEV